jgi:hypothetical protein
MRIINLRDERAWGWRTGAFGYRAFCIWKWAIGK